MAENSNWNGSLWGRAKAAFNKVRASAPPPAKQVEKTAGHDSEIIKKTRPLLEGPRPPGGYRTIVKQQELRQNVAKNPVAARSTPQPEARKIQPPVIQSEHLKEAVRLRDKFKKATEKDRDKGR